MRPKRQPTKHPLTLMLSSSPERLWLLNSIREQNRSKPQLVLPQKLSELTNEIRRGKLKPGTRPVKMPERMSPVKPKNTKTDQFMN